MAQENALYAVARIRCHESGLIGRERMARMIAGTADEALQVLTGAGYGGAAAAEADADVEALIAAELAQAYALVREVSPDPALTELFLMQADVHNLKVLYKLRLLGGGDGSPALMQGGAYEPAQLGRMVREGDYGSLPEPLAAALRELDEAFAHAPADPVRVSTALDGAYFEMGYASKSAFAVEYFKAKADFENALILLRMGAMGASRERMEQVLMPAGNIPKETYLRAAEQPAEQWGRLLSEGPAGDALKKALEDTAHGGAAQAVERARDNYLIRLAERGRVDQDTVAPIVGYLLAREQEARCVRLIMTAKRNGLGEAIITERMRVLYGE